MTALRKLGALYLAAASAFVMAGALQQHPDWSRHSAETAAAARDGTAKAAAAVNRAVIQPAWHFAQTQTSALVASVEQAMKSAPSRVAQEKQPEKAVPPAVPKRLPPPVVARNAAPPSRPAIAAAPKTVAPSAEAPAPKVAEAAPAKRMELAPQAPEAAPPPDRSAPSPAEIVRVSERLRASLTPEMLDHFGLFLYVSKADRGPLAQRMYVYQKQDSGDLALLYNWPVSTGREKIELTPEGARQPSFTPQGYYELDPERHYRRYHSMQWDQPMPYAMFFNWEHEGLQTGLAIHGASGEDIGLLGERASAGCVRLAPENAQLLYELIQKDYRGLMPKFAYDKRTATMSNDGVLLHDHDGRLELTQGYKVLVLIENFGGENVVAALF